MALGPQFPLAVVMRAVDRLSGPLSKVEGRIGLIAATSQKVGRGLTRRVSAPILAVGAASIFAGARFEEAIVKIRANTDAGETAIARLEKRAMELGGTPPFGPTEVARGMAELAFQGLSANEVLAETSNVLDLATAAGEPLEDTIKTSTGLMRAWGDQAGSLRSIGDRLTTTFGDTRATLGGLSNVLSRTGPIAREYGVNLDELLALAGALADEFVTDEQAATAIRIALQRLAKPAGEARNILAELGVRREQLFDSEGNLISFANALDVLSEAGAEGHHIIGLFGEEAGANLIPLLRRGGDSIRKFQERLGPQAFGRTAREAQERMQGASMALNGLMGSLENLGIAVARSGILEFLTESTRKLAGWINSLSQSEKRLLAWGVIVLGAAAIVGPLLVAGVALAGTMKALGLATVGVTAAIGGAIAAGVALRTHWDSVVDVAKRVGTAIRKWVGGAWDWVIQKMRAVVTLGGRLDLFPEPAATPGPGGAQGPPLGGRGGEGRFLEERTSRVELDFVNVPAGVTVRTSGDELPAELGLVMR